MNACDVDRHQCLHKDLGYASRLCVFRAFFQVAIVSSESSLILVLNCGSSSIKYALYQVHDGIVPRTAYWSGKIEDIGGESSTYQAQGQRAESVSLDRQAPYQDAVALIRLRVRQRLAGRSVDAVVHRIVHGGSKYFEPVKINSDVLEDLRSYIPLAPLHQPFALETVDVLLESAPDVPQYACFDTAFHHTLPRVEKILPLPWTAWEKGLRRYGFHGLSYEYIAHVLSERYGRQAEGRVLVAHLGNGASLCGMKNLHSVTTTMGFSTLDGLMMGTRGGALDPGVILHMMEVERMPLERVGQILTRESGLLGVSGISSDTRVLLAQEDTNERARVAMELYVRSIIREIGAVTALLGGLDMLVFTAGVGEHNATIRERVCNGLAYLGVMLDDAANEQNAPVISLDQSGIRVLVEPTNEEWIAAEHAARLRFGD